MVQFAWAKMHAKLCTGHPQFGPVQMLRYVALIQ